MDTWTKPYHGLTHKRVGKLQMTVSRLDGDDGVTDYHGSIYSVDPASFPYERKEQWFDTLAEAKVWCEANR